MPLSEKALVALNSIKADFTPVAHADMMKVINASPKFIEQINAFVDREGTITVGPRVGGNAAYSTGESDVAAGGLNTIGGKISFDKNANFKRIDGWSDGYGMAEALAHELGHAFDPGMGATARGAAFSQGGLSKLTYLSVTSEAKGELNAIVLMAEARTNLATANSSSAGNGAKLFADWRMTAFPAVEVAIGALNKSTVAGSLAQTCTVNDTCLKMVTDIMGRAPIFGESAGYNYFKTTIEALDPNAVYVAPQVLSTGNENYVLVPDSANSGRMNVVDKRTGEVVQTIDFQVFEDGSSFFVVSNIGGGFSTLDGGSDGTSRQVDYPIAGDLRFSSTSVRDKDGNVIKSVVDTPGANGGVNRHVEMVIDGKVVEIDQHASSSSTADGVQVGDFRTTAITIGGFPLPESVEAIFSEALDTALSTTDDILEAAANGDVVQVFEAVDMSDLDGWSPEPSGSGATPAWYSVAEVQRLGGLLTSMQSLVAGLETGKPLPIATGIFSIAAHLSNGGGPLGEINSGLGLINGAINLRAALERGDVTAVITSGANLSVGALTIYRTILQAQLADAVSKGLTVSVDQLKGELASVTSVLDGLSNALPFLNLINAIAHGDELGMVSATMAILYEYFAVAWAGPVGIAIAVYQVLKALIDSSDIHGEAKFIKTSNGGVEALLTHDELGGGAAVMTAMDGMINALEATMTDLEGMGIIAQRLPSLMFDGFTGGGGQFTLRYNDAKTGEQFQRSFDENGKFIGIGGGVAPDLDPYNGTFPDPDDVQWEGEIAKTDSFFSNLYQQFLTFSYEVGAVAPTWMVQTINSQETHLAGTTEAGLAGLTTLQIAKDQQQLLETDPGDGNLRPTGEQYVRPVVLDLDGGGFAPKTTRETGGGVLIDVDDDGFAEQTEWIGPREGILVIDRNGDGRISGGHEMFNDSQVVMSERGLTVLREIDANLDGQLTSADFSFAHLRVWQDINHDGEAQSYELSSMSERDISALNYTTGQFTMDGTVRSMALADLTADSAGYMTQTLGEGGNSLLVTQETGQIFLMATALFNPTVSEIEWVRNDLTHVGAGGALIVVDELMDGMEDTPIKVSAAQLLDNDFSQSGTLNITVGSAVHGSVSFSGGTFTFTPTLNYHSNYAALDFASFTYTVSDGQNSVTGTAYIDVVAVDEVPVLENEYDSRPLGWGDVTFVGGDVMNGILPNYIVTGTLEYENDVQWGLQVAQQAPTNLGPPNNPKILGFYNGKAYIADSASNLNWREVQLVDNGSGKVKPSGGVGALTMEVLNGGSTQFGELNFNKQTGDWIYKHTASHALDDAFMIQVTDSLGTVTQHKVIVTNPDSWAGNYFWEDYYAQDWINSSVRDGGAAASAARAATSANAARASAATARADAAAAAESGDPDAATNAANASNLADAAALNAVLAADAAARAAADWGPAAASLA
jgi:hypothetical protein